MTRPACALVAAGGVLVVAICGCGSPGQPARGAGTPVGAAESTPTPEASRPAVDITRPAAGAVVKALPGAHTSLAATIAVQGFAPPGSHVRLRTGCPARPCRAEAKADGNGMWRLRVRVSAPRRRPAVTLRATSSVPGPPRRRRIRLKARHESAVVRRSRTRSAAPPASGAPAPAVTPTPTPAPTVTPARRMVLIGDSLAVGIQQLLPGLLPGWTVRSNALTGRSLAAGMDLVEQADLTSQPTVLAVSLFTNDDPRATDALARAVQRSVGLVGPHGCAVWATIVRPPFAGVSYAAANRVLRRLAAADGGALLVVPWAAAVARHRDWIGPDHVHGTVAGYRGRAAMYAQAARACRR